MPHNIDFFDTYHLIAVAEEVTPTPSFFKDRYFPTGEEDIFSTDKVLTQYRSGDNQMAAFVAPGVGDIGIDRRGYEVSEYTPAYIAPSRLLTVDELSRRGFGEALYTGSTPAERAIRLQLQDAVDLEARIRRREEWMCVQTMLHNACTMQTYVDAATEGEMQRVQFYTGESEHEFIPTSKWSAPDGDFFGDVRAMCMALAMRGLPTEDLIVGTQVADMIENDQKVYDRLKNDRMNYGVLDPALMQQYPGVSLLGRLNFGGYWLNIFVAAGGYANEGSRYTPYLPPKSAIVTAPNCGRMRYAAVTQIDYGSTEYTTYAAKRVPGLIIDRENDVRKLRYRSRPLAMPVNYCPYMVIKEAV